MSAFNDARVRRLNDAPPNRTGDYVLYWCQMFRRLRANHALDYAIACARALGKPLVIYEGLKLDYPWASARFHRFVLDGMRDNAAAAKRAGANYWPFVETPGNPGRGLVRRLCERACLLVTDDYPQFVVPAHNLATAATVAVPVHAVDGNGIIPLSRLGPAVSAAAHLRHRIHKQFAEAWGHRAATEPDFTAVSEQVAPPFDVWQVPKDIGAFVASLPVDPSVQPVTGAVGGSAAGQRVLTAFVEGRLRRYADHRGQPGDPDIGAASRLSGYLHYGHVGVQEVCEAVLGVDWTPGEINHHTRTKNDFFCRDENVNSFLDEVITWRDVGYYCHHTRLFSLGGRAGTRSRPADTGETPSFNFETFDFSPLPRSGTLAGVLPAWANATLQAHAADRRDPVYDLDELEAGDSHDELWNAAQRELVATGRIHNYLRMLWGKKVLEWSPTPERAYRVLEHLNNKYALDGRDPNSYSGLLWCFGLYDRPWPPERDVFGTVRYMSSANTAKKFQLASYYEYVRRLPTPAQVGAGDVAVKPGGPV